MAKRKLLPLPTRGSIILLLQLECLTTIIYIYAEIVMLVSKSAQIDQIRWLNHCTIHSFHVLIDGRIFQQSVK